MKMKLRKAQGFKSPDLYEWQAAFSKTWYRIHAENMVCVGGQDAEENIISLAEKGETVMLEAFFLKDAKVLLIKRKVSSQKEKAE